MYMGLFRKKKKRTRDKSFFDTSDVFEVRLEKEWRKNRR